MYDYQLNELLEELNLDYYKFAESASYDETDEGRKFSIADIANYIDTQLHLKNSKN